MRENNKSIKKMQKIRRFPAIEELKQLQVHRKKERIEKRRKEEMATKKTTIKKWIEFTVEGGEATAFEPEIRGWVVYGVPEIQAMAEACEGDGLEMRRVMDSHVEEAV